MEVILVIIMFILMGISLILVMIYDEIQAANKRGKELYNNYKLGLEISKSLKGKEDEQHY